MLEFLVCPKFKNKLKLTIQEKINDNIKIGKFICISCQKMTNFLGNEKQNIEKILLEISHKRFDIAYKLSV